MTKKKLKKNEVHWIKDTLVIQYKGVNEKNPRPYLVLIESRNYCITYPLTTKKGLPHSYRIEIEIENMKKSYIKLLNPTILPRDIKSRYQNKINEEQSKFLMQTINMNKKTIKLLRGAYKIIKENEKNIEKTKKITWVTRWIDP